MSSQGIGSHRVLPMLPGYAIGSIIKKNDLELHFLKEERSRLQQTVDTILLEDNYRMMSIVQKKTSDSCKHHEIVELDAEIKRNEDALKEVKSKIIKLLSENTALLSWEETLPLDRHQSIMRVEARGDPSETFKDCEINKEMSVRGQMDQLISSMFLQQDTSVACLRPGTINTMAASIENMVKTGHKVKLIGCVITLNRVRIMDPIVLRKEAKISENLLINCSNYYVITEAFLGAVFLGFSTVVTESEISNSSQRGAKTMNSSMTMVSYISQGAIPKMGNSLHNMDLRAVFRSWKEELMSDMNTGYPIRFTCRNLRDIFLENKVTLI
jgi:hypothetical protein